MVSSEIIRSILESAVQAPSGENAQPWRFEVAGDSITIFNIPEIDQSLYNFEQRTSYIANGTVVENIAIAATHHHLAASIAVAPDPNDPNLIARITLAPASTGEDPLYGQIAKRTTNRKKYNGGAIPPQTVGALRGASSGLKGVSLKFITDSIAIQGLAQCASAFDILLLENRHLHDFFFSHLNWTKEQEEKIRSGLFIETLELDLPVKKMFSLFKHWPLMRIFNALGAARAGAKQNRGIYASASAMGIITIADESVATFINAGRAMQRVWLTATANGINMQPLTGVLIFHQRLEHGVCDGFPAKQQKIIRKSYEGIRDIFDVKQGVITMMFRLGYADPPTASSVKKLPDIVMAGK